MMNNRKKKAGILAVLISISLLTTGCAGNDSADESENKGNNEETTAGEQQVNSEGESVSETEEHAAESTVTLTEGKYSEEKLDDTWDEDEAVKVQLNGESISMDTSEGIDTDGSTVTITGEGTYFFIGELKDGQIIVDTDKETFVKLVFSGVNISCSDTAPVYIKGGNTIITLAAGTENTITDGESYVCEEDGEDEPGAAIFSKDDLTFNGTGSLTVNANYNNGIQSKDDLKFVNGTYVNTAKDDGMVGKDSVSVKNGDFTIQSGGDGIKSTNMEETDKGYILLENGTFQITSDGDAIQAETLLRINDGSFDIVAGGSVESVGSSNGNRTDSTDDTSTKGLKSYVELLIAGGEYSIDTYDDGVHSGKNVQIDSGTFVINSGDDGIHAEESLLINAGNIDIQQSYEGLEGFEIVINDGDIRVVSRDDGINAAGGDSAEQVNENGDFQKDGRMMREHMPADDSGEASEAMPNGVPEEMKKEMPGGMPKDMAEGMQEKPEAMEKPEGNMKGGMRSNMGGGMPGENQGASLTINGGTIYVNAEGDGLDANGDILMTGGDVTVHGPTNGGNGTLDFGGTCKMDGGIFRGVGSSGMAQSPDEDSEQPTIVWNIGQTLEAGTSILLKDSTGKQMDEIITEKSIQWYAFSSPELTKGEVYTISVGNVEKEVMLGDSMVCIVE